MKVMLSYIKTRCLLFVLCFAYVNTSYSQNLVYNPSFEEYIVCPFNEAQIDYATGWSKTTGDADFYHGCSTNPESTVPPATNYQLPATDSGFAGLITYLKDSGSLEIIQTQLMSPLSIGVEYYASFKVNLALNGNASLNMALNKLGAKLTMGAMPALNNSAHIFTSAVILDTLNWTTISGSFTADSAYTHLFLGIFFQDSNINASIIVPSLNMDRAYYYFDDVCLSPDPFTCEVAAMVADQDNNIGLMFYPNPSSGTISLATQASYHTRNFSVYNILGSKMLGAEIIDDQVDISSLPDGVYFLRIETENGIVTEKVVKQAK